MWKNIEDNKKCLEMWEKEAECRDRKKTFKQMAKVDKKETEDVGKKVEKKSYKSLYPPLTGCGGPLLDACLPPPQLQNPPPQLQIPPPQLQIPFPQLQIPLPELQIPPPQLQNPPPQLQIPPPQLQIPFPQLQIPLPELQIPLPQLQIPPPQQQNPPPYDVQRPDSTNERSGPSQTLPTAPQVYGDGAAGGPNDDVTSTSSLGSDSFSPISSRTRRSQQQGEVITAPMINVMGPTGPALVYRPWTDADMTEALTHLPDPRNSGTAFAVQFETFCHEFMPTVSEIRRLLMKKLGPTDFAKIRQHCGGDLRLTSPDWDDAANAAYVNALNTLLNALRTTFPNKIDMSKITGCKQLPGETVGDFLTRLTVLFNQHSGIPIPDNLGDEPGAYETHLKQAFLNGLLPPLRADVGHTCIGLEDARLTEVRRHAEHAERQHKETKDKNQQKKEHQLQKAQLTMLQAVSALSRPHRQDNADNRAYFTEPGRGGRGRGRGRGRDFSRQFQIPRDECFICRQKGHWAKDCPHQREERETRTFTAD